MPDSSNPTPASSPKPEEPAALEPKDAPAESAPAKESEAEVKPAAKGPEVPEEEPVNSRLAARQSRFRGNLSNFVSVVLVLFIYLMVNFLGFKYYDRWDVSPSGLYNLSGKTEALLANLPGPVTITTFFTRSSENPSKLSAQIYKLIESYQGKGGSNIQVRILDPLHDHEEARSLARELNFGEDSNLVIFEYEGKKLAVPEDRMGAVQQSGFRPGDVRLVSFDGEAVFTSTIQSLVEGEASVVYFLAGHGELSLEDASSFAGVGKIRPMIERDNIQPRSLNLLETGDVPEDADALVVMGPRQSLAKFEVEAISRYLDANGKLYLMQAPDTTSGLEALLPRYGLRLANDVLRARANLGGQTRLISNVLVNFSDHPSVVNLQKFNLELKNVRSIFLLPNSDGQPNPKVFPLLVAPEAYWGETNLADPAASFDPRSDTRGPLAVAAAYDGGKVADGEVEVAGTRLVVIGTTEFLANRSVTSAGLDFFLNTLDWMLEKELAVGIAPKAPAEFPIAISPLQMRVIVASVCVVVPLLVLLLGGILWYTRRN
ncbi:MAG: Gldg family protein [Verrucomicrobiota bacterium]